MSTDRGGLAGMRPTATAVIAAGLFFTALACGVMALGGLLFLAVRSVLAPRRLIASRLIACPAVRAPG
ncbi:hypothetical protein ACWCQL_13920 [Streptomyces sp. NPDC002073]